MGVSRGLVGAWFSEKGRGVASFLELCTDEMEAFLVDSRAESGRGSVEEEEGVTVFMADAELMGMSVLMDNCLLGGGRRCLVRGLSGLERSERAGGERLRLDGGDFGRRSLEGVLLGLWSSGLFEGAGAFEGPENKKSNGRR